MQLKIIQEFCIYLHLGIFLHLDRPELSLEHNRLLLGHPNMHYKKCIQRLQAVELNDKPCLLRRVENERISELSTQKMI